ncbi:MAG TPA: secondary thiamine-phosphate synthase enzyme YjbQ [Candidatus Lokiarchaeia archaeon]|nr:secondary thiamine-phosphate synthase enzyme YjbQ [Candidatus Lokiarchaeia archaeon]
MTVDLASFTVKTPQREIFVDITSKVSNIVSRGSISEGVCRVFVPHTTAAVTINENADPDVRLDIINILREIAPQAGKVQLRHGEGNADAHLKSSIVGCCQEILIHEKSLLLGTWQGIYFCEFDGPRTRQVHVQLHGE